jgi:DNA-binding NarL/FixJ family response regulator
MLSHIRVAILDDHQSIIDGYIYRLSVDPAIQVVATALYGAELESMLSGHEVDVLLLDVSVPNSAENHNPFPVLYTIPRLLQGYPSLNILAISMFTQRTLIEALVDAGICGYIFKDDQSSIQQLAKIMGIIANGGVYFSQGAYRDLRKDTADPVLTPRQLEALSLCNATPDSDTISLANKLGITGSTMRNLLSGAYLRLGVRTRAAAIAKAHQLGILPDLPKMTVSSRKKSFKS